VGVLLGVFLGYSGWLPWCCYAFARVFWVVVKVFWVVARVLLAVAGVFWVVARVLPDGCWGVLVCF